MIKINQLINEKIAIITFVIWIILNISGIQNIYFAVDVYTIKVAIVKIAHLFFLYYVINKIYLLYKERNTEKGKYEIIYTSIYLIITSILVIITWPGTWSWDDIFIMKNVSYYNLTPWQHFFSGLFHAVCIQTIPISAGVIIIQILISSLIVGYCISNISILFGKNKKQKTIIQIGILIITLFPPVILYILSGFRMGIYSYIELLLISKLLIIYKERRKLEIKDILLISFLTIIISCWRTEGLYYPLILLILFCVLGNECIRKKTAIATLLIIVIFNYSIGKYNNYQIGNNNYSIVATIEPVTSIIKIADESDAKEIEKIDKVIDTKYVLENPNMEGVEYFWIGIAKKYSKEEYIDYLKSYIKLTIKYPKTVLNSMWNIFNRAGSGLGKDCKQTTINMIPNTLIMYAEGNVASKAWSEISSKFKNPINLKLRNEVISFLAGIDSKENLTIIHNVFWNLFIPFTLILICLIYKLIKKEWYMVFLIILVITRIPLVFISSPAPYFMYYLSAYLCSYVLAFIIIFEFISNLRNKKDKGEKIDHER